MAVLLIMATSEECQDDFCFISDDYWEELKDDEATVARKRERCERKKGQDIIPEFQFPVCLCTNIYCHCLPIQYDKWRRRKNCYKPTHRDNLHWRKWYNNHYWGAINTAVVSSDARDLTWINSKTNITDSRLITVTKMKMNLLFNCPCWVWNQHFRHHCAVVTSVVGEMEVVVTLPDIESASKITTVDVTDSISPTTKTSTYSEVGVELYEPTTKIVSTVTVSVDCKNLFWNKHFLQHLVTIANTRRQFLEVQTV